MTAIEASSGTYRSRVDGTELELLALTKTRLGVFDKAEYRL